MNDTLTRAAPFIPLANFLVSIGMASLGLLLYRKRQRDLFAAHPFLRWAFWFLFWRWMFLVGVYGIVIFFGQHQAWLMAVLDLQSVCDIGFAWIFIQGDEFSHTKTLESLSLLCAVLWLWNLMLQPGSMPLLEPATASSAAIIAAHAKWAAASEALSAFTIPLVGFSFLLRYRILEALALFIFSLGYAVLQRPIYFATLLASTTISKGILEVPGYLFGLLIGKLVLGGMIYGFFFAEVEKYSVVTSKLPKQTVRAIRKGLWKSAIWTGRLALALVLAIAADIIVKKFHLIERISAAR